MESGNKNCFLFLYHKISTYKYVHYKRIKVHVSVYNNLDKSNRETHKATLKIRHNERQVNSMTVKFLKPYKGYEIEKSYETKADGTIRKDTIIYTAYAEEDGSLYDGAKTLEELKRKIDIYTK